MDVQEELDSVREYFSQLDAPELWKRTNAQRMIMSSVPKLISIIGAQQHVIEILQVDKESYDKRI